MCQYQHVFMLATSTYYKQRLSAMTKKGHSRKQIDQ